VEFTAGAKDTSELEVRDENRSANEARDIRRGSDHACGYQLNHPGDPVSSADHDE
jgi:hypothetical protein